MLCQNCQKNVATVRVTELLDDPDAAAQDEPQVTEEHLCEICAQTRNLPHAPVAKKSVTDILKLLQFSAQQSAARKRPTLSCPHCGMTWEEFRKKGRFGCPEDYRVFQKPLSDLLERMHGATEHIGRMPGVSNEELARIQRVSELKRDLESAIRDEAYESAAKIRDELKSLEIAPQEST